MSAARLCRNEKADSSTTNNRSRNSCDGHCQQDAGQSGDSGAPQFLLAPPAASLLATAHSPTPNPALKVR